MKSIFKKIKLWYTGYTEHHDYINDPIHPRQEIVIHKPSLLKNIIDPLTRFWLRHWKWIIGTIIAIGVLVASFGQFLIMYIKYYKNIP